MGPSWLVKVFDCCRQNRHAVDEVRSGVADAVGSPGCATGSCAGELPPMLGLAHELEPGSCESACGTEVVVRDVVASVGAVSGDGAAAGVDA